jgi:hypothetical protein
MRNEQPELRNKKDFKGYQIQTNESLLSPRTPVNLNSQQYRRQYENSENMKNMHFNKLNNYPSPLSQNMPQKSKYSTGPIMNFNNMNYKPSNEGSLKKQFSSKGSNTLFGSSEDSKYRKFQSKNK